jgi:putative oxidoreductase
MKYNKVNAWNMVIFLVRIWLGYRMFTASFSSVTGIITSPKERIFFAKWFGEELHFPIPLVMAFLAKGSELAGGIFVLLGLYTKASASLIAFIMLVATLTANLGKDFNIDGGFTISYFLFALILLVEGGGKYSLDHILFPSKVKRNKNLKELQLQEESHAH